MFLKTLAGDAAPTAVDCETLAKDVLTVVSGSPVTKKDIEYAVKKHNEEIYNNPDARPYLDSLRDGIYKAIIKISTAGKIVFPQELIISKAQDVLIDINLQAAVSNTDSAIRNATGTILFSALSGTNVLNTFISDKVLLGLALITLVRMVYKLALSIIQENLAKTTVARLSKEMTRVENFAVLLEYLEKNISGRYRFLIKKYMKKSLQASLLKYADRQRQLKKIFLILEKAQIKQWSNVRLYDHLERKYDYIFYRLGFKHDESLTIAEMQKQIKDKMKDLKDEITVDTSHVEELRDKLTPSYNADLIRYNIVEMMIQSVTLQLEPLFLEAKKK